MNHEDAPTKRQILGKAMGDAIEVLPKGSTSNENALLFADVTQYLVNGVLGIEEPADRYNKDYLPAAVGIVDEAVKANDITEEVILDFFDITKDVAERIRQAGGYVGYLAIRTEEWAAQIREEHWRGLSGDEKAGILASIEFTRAAEEEARAKREAETRKKERIIRRAFKRIDPMVATGKLRYKVGINFNCSDEYLAEFMDHPKRYVVVKGIYRNPVYYSGDGTGIQEVGSNYYTVFEIVSD